MYLYSKSLKPKQKKPLQQGFTYADSASSNGGITLRYLQY